MKSFYWLPIAALAAFAADCGEIIDDTDTDSDTEDYFCEDCDLVITSINPVCTPGTPDSVTFTAVFGAWAETVTLDMLNTGAGEFPDTISGVWDETHIFPATANTEFAADGTSDTWVFDLEVVGAPNLQTDGTNTFLGCDFYDQTDGAFNSTAFKLHVTPDRTDDNDTCAIFGWRSEHATAFGGDGCECFEDFLATPPANPCGRGN